MREISIPSVATSSHMPSLDGFRGVAILLVIWEHAYGQSFAPLTGTYGVYIFFVLSGFLITTLLLTEKVKTGKISLRNFYIRRALRILPVAYLYLLVLAILNVLLHLGIPLGSFLRSALYIQNTTIIDAPGTYVNHFWTLSIEEQFYLLFPFFIKTNLRWYIILACVVIGITPMISYMVVNVVTNVPWFTWLQQILRLMPSLLIGSLLSVLMFYRIIVLPDKVPYRSIIITIAFVVSWVLTSMPKLILSTALSFTASFVLIAIMIAVSLVPGSDPVYRLLNSRVLTTIGVYSYSAYVWQQIFTLHKPWVRLFPGADSPILNLLVLAVVVYVSYNFYEKNFLKLKMRFK